MQLWGVWVACAREQGWVAVGRASITYNAKAASSSWGQFRTDCCCEELMTKGLQMLAELKAVLL